MNSALVGTPIDALGYLQTFADALDIRELANFVLGDWRFSLWSGSSKPFQHHYGKGGLVVHTAEVVKLCIENNRLMGKPIEEKWLFSAALFHDAGKMWDYEPIVVPSGLEKEYTEWQGSSHKRHIHHISRSALVWNEAASEISCKAANAANSLLGKIPTKLFFQYHELHQGVIDEVLHAILAHHGQREWGSPVSPNTKLAWMLHLCDGISARMDDAERWDRHK